MAKEKFSITSLVNNDGCFDLQFRKDTRHERTNAPTYYRWKTQFVITGPKDNVKVLERVKKELKCGEVCVTKNQARFSVQKIGDVAELVVPFFKKNQLAGLKKKDFDLWAKAVEILEKNKGKQMLAWKKNDIHSLIEIQKSSSKYKNKPRKAKWLSMAKLMS